MRRYRYKATRRWTRRPPNTFSARTARNALLDRMAWRTLAPCPHHHSYAYLAYVIRESVTETVVLPVVPEILKGM